MIIKIIWGITPTNQESHFPSKIFGEKVIESKSLVGAKKRAKSFTTRCDKLKNICRDNTTRTWIYWKD